MMNLTVAKTVFAASFVALVALSAPLYADAASKRDSCEFEGDAGLDADSLFATSSRPTVSGVASTTRAVQLVLRKEGSEKVVYKSKVLRVKGDEWSVRVPKKLKDGEYDVAVYCPKVSRGSVIATGTLVVGEPKESSHAPKAGTVVTVAGVPLLSGGVAGAGESVPVAYLNVKNTGKTSVQINGFWVKQNGTAPAKTIDSFTVVDGTGDSRITTKGEGGGTPLKDGAAFVKTKISIPAGGFSLFTIKANLAASLGLASGKTLKIDVTDAIGAAKTSAKFPIRGTTWELR